MRGEPDMAAAVLFVIVFGAFARSKSNKPPARQLPNERPQFVTQNMGQKAPKNQAFAAATSARASLPISAAGRPGLYSAEPMP